MTSENLIPRILHPQYSVNSMKIFIATKNKDKIKEISRILIPHDIDVITEADIETELAEVEETGTTFAENAFIKAQNGCNQTGLITIADDSGICIDAFDGAPGVYSARFLPGMTYPEKNDEIIKRLEGAKTRKAHYTCAICVVAPNGKTFTVEGEFHGEIAHSQRGTNGFGYDPIFKVGDKTVAELDSEQKDKISHRGKALALFEQKLPEFLESIDLC